MSDADIWRGIISLNRRIGMVKFINKFTGNAMYVSESRVEEYKAAGHKIAESKPKSTKNRKKKEV